MQRPVSAAGPSALAFAPAVLAGSAFVALVAWLALRAEAVDTRATLFGAVPALVCTCAALGGLSPDRGWRHGAVAGSTAGLLAALVLAVGGLPAATLVRGLPLCAALVAATTFASAVGARVRRALAAHRATG